MAKRTRGPEDGKTAEALNNLGLLFKKIGDYAKAEPLYQEALRIRQKVLGSEHLDTATSLNKASKVFDRKAQRPENVAPARVYPENVIFEWPAVSGPDSGGVSWTHPWKSKMTIIAHAVTIRRHTLTLMNPLYADANTAYSF